MTPSAAADSPASSDGKGLSVRLLLTMVGLGFVSGLPLFLTNRVLQQWMTENGVSLTTIGAVGVIGLPYTLKFLWAPLLDRLPPGPVRDLGRRRGWLLLAQLGVTAAIVALALADPQRNVSVVVGCAVALAFFSATQDTAIDAWRIESVASDQQAGALGMYVWGYRTAMVVSLSGTIWLAGNDRTGDLARWLNPFGWHGAYGAMAVLSLAGPLLCLTLPEPALSPAVQEGWRAAMQRSVLLPFADLCTRPAAVWVLLFIVTFHLGTQFADTLMIPLYRHLGYTHNEVAAAAGIPNLVAALVGAATAGILVRYLGLARALILSTLMQMASLSVYFVLLGHPPSQGLLIGKTVLEEFAEATAQTTFLSYLSLLCSRKFAATQYALLSALATIGWRTLGGWSGSIEGNTGWCGFYIFALACCLPSIGLMLYLLRRFPDGVPPRVADDVIGR